jgi:Methyltransferase domain
MIRASHPPGHFYSPVVDPSQLQTRADQLWPADPTALGIDFNDASHQHILLDVLPRHLPEYAYAEVLNDSPELRDFYTQNSQFSWLDARTLFALLREWRPARLIEVGSGYSTLLIADVNRRYCDGAIDVTCIEPYPRDFLRKPIAGMSRILDLPVQRVALTVFSTLEAGDVLFIDSSHVAKTGSDVNFLLFEVLPRLAKGVRIHIHDIFLPNEYPCEWVLQENRSWNEQYVVRALLMFSSGFRVLFGCSYALERFPELVRGALAFSDGRVFGGGSLWIERL